MISSSREIDSRGKTLQPQRLDVPARIFSLYERDQACSRGIEEGQVLYNWDLWNRVVLWPPGCLEASKLPVPSFAGKPLLWCSFWFQAAKAWNIGSLGWGFFLLVLLKVFLTFQVVIPFLQELGSSERGVESRQGHWNGSCTIHWFLTFCSIDHVWFTSSWSLHCFMFALWGLFWWPRNYV